MTLLEQLLDAIAEQPNALESDLETGSHHWNNAVHAEWAKKHPRLCESMNRIAKLAQQLEEQKP